MTFDFDELVIHFEVGKVAKIEILNLNSNQREYCLKPAWLLFYCHLERVSIYLVRVVLSVHVIESPS